MAAPDRGRSRSSVERLAAVRARVPKFTRYRLALGGVLALTLAFARADCARDFGAVRLHARIEPTSTTSLRPRSYTVARTCRSRHLQDCCVSRTRTTLPRTPSLPPPTTTTRSTTATSTDTGPNSRTDAVRAVSTDRLVDVRELRGGPVRVHRACLRGRAPGIRESHGWCQARDVGFCSPEPCALH